MFTGIIQKVGKVEAMRGSSLRVSAALNPRPGDSVAINGVCLTVTADRRKNSLSFDVSQETLDRTNLGSLTPGAVVNIEPALRAGDPLGGHLVSGHVDATAKMLEKEALPDGFVRIRIELPSTFAGLVVLKGSIAVDGVSLTVTKVGRGFFETVIVPHTLAQTNLASRRPGERVNLEADMLARYVRAALEARR